MHIFNNRFVINLNYLSIDTRNCNHVKLGIYNINFSVIVNRTARFTVPLFHLIHVHSIGVRDIMHICDIFTVLSVSQTVRRITNE